MCCSIQDAADLLGLNRATVYNLIATGEFCKTVHFGKSVRVPLDELRSWLAARVAQEYEAKRDQARSLAPMKVIKPTPAAAAAKNGTRRAR